LTLTTPSADRLRIFPDTLPGPLTTLQIIAVLLALVGSTVPLRVNGVPTTAVSGTLIILVTGWITVMLNGCI
jgi:hypothetical protein